MEFIKSPLNYTGGKYKLLPQLLKLFPTELDTFVDLFAGGGDLCVNAKAKHVIYNDIMGQVSEILKEFKEAGADKCLERIDRYIKEYQLSKENKEGYLELRDRYNNSFDLELSLTDPIMLYTLICYSFNNQIRFNRKGAYNMPFGKGRSSFNPALREKLIAFVNRLQEIDIQFFHNDFRAIKVEGLGLNDFVYCDPPYLITVASYNENGGWGEQDEIDLLAKLDEIDRAGVKFGLSNVLESKGKENSILKAWGKKYNINYLTHSYSNCSYHKKDKDSKDVEVLITNY